MKDERILVYAVYEFTTQAVTKRPSKKERAKKKKKKVQNLTLICLRFLDVIPDGLPARRTVNR